jgi:hypothetical protein
VSTLILRLLKDRKDLSSQLNSDKNKINIDVLVKDETPYDELPKDIVI